MFLYNSSKSTKSVTRYSIHLPSVNAPFDAKSLNTEAARITFHCAFIFCKRVINPVCGVHKSYLLFSCKKAGSNRKSLYPVRSRIMLSPLFGKYREINVSRCFQWYRDWRCISPCHTRIVIWMVREYISMNLIVWIYVWNYTNL